MGEEQSNRDVVRLLGERWNAGDLEGMLELYADDMQMITDPRWPDPPAEDKQAFARSTREWLASWDKVDIDIAHIDARGDKVVAEGAWETRGAASGIDGTMPFGILFTLREGLVVRLQWFLHADEARAAAGL